MEKKPKTMRLAKDLAIEYIDSLDARQRGEKHFLQSGLKTLDKKIPGWLHEGHLVIVAGRPSMGKSAFAQQIAEFVAEQRTAIFFTLEMSSYEITERAISRRSGVPIPTLKTADKVSKDDWEAISRAFVQFSELSLLVDDASFDIASIVHKSKAAAQHVEKAGLPALGCIVIDYVQLVQAKAANRTLEVGQVTNSLKKLAKDLSVPVIALSQLNRGVEGRPNKRPTLADLRESGQIEQDADIVLFLYRDEYYHDDSADKGIAEVIAAKNRHGPTGVVKLAFVSERLMFGDLAHDAHE